MSNRSILLDLAVGTTVIMDGVTLLFLVLSVPFIAVPACGLLGFGLCFFIRGWRAAWSD